MENPIDIGADEPEPPRPHPIKALPIGTPIVYNATLSRHVTQQRGWNTQKEWRRGGIDARPGVYIGWRTLFDGTTEFDDDGAVFHPSRHFPAALVVFDARCSPVLVPMDAIVLKA